MHYDLIIWDIDGTLLDTHQGVACALTFALQQYGISKSQAEILEMVHAPKVKDAFINIAKLDENETKHATDLFRQQYLEHDLFKAVPYDGIMDVLENCRLHGAKQAIATNKRQDCATQICRHFNLDKFCNPICGGDRYNSLSKADLIKQCFAVHHIAAVQSAVMIGDMTSDKNAAEQVGIDFIGVNYGFGFRNVAGYADTPYEILKFLSLE
jgi:phosphoglycolate phosphatase